MAEMGDDERLEFKI